MSPAVRAVCQHVCFEDALARYSHLGLHHFFFESLMSRDLSCRQGIRQGSIIAYNRTEHANNVNNAALSRRRHHNIALSGCVGVLTAAITLICLFVRSSMGCHCSLSKARL